MSAAGFFSYTHFDNDAEDGQLTELRERLQKEVCQRLGEKFELFQDIEGIAWGQQWQKRLDQGMAASTVFIPIVTPSYLRRPPCRDELEKFLKKEKAMGRDDLVLPLIYIESPAVTDATRRSQDPLAEAIAAHQYRDWRDLRREPWTNPSKLKRLDSIAEEIVKALERTEAVTGKTKRKSAAVPKTTAKAKGKAKPESSGKADIPAAKDAIMTVGEPNHSKAGGPKAIQDPVTLSVHPMPGWGDYTTIAAAIAAAKGGERILIHPHHYQEALVLDKPLELIGQGNREHIVVEGTGGDVILFKTTFGRISNLTLRQMGGGNFFGVDIGQGQLVLEECDITSSSRSCVAIHHGANPILKRNRIHDGKHGGVFIFENGRGTLEDNDIFANSMAGIAIRAGSDPILRRNRIHDGKQGGVMIYENGKGTLEENDIFANALAGVEIKTGSDPVLRRNRIHDGKHRGVFIYENGRGTLEDNDIFANAGAEVAIKGGGDPVLRRNRIHDGRQCGVFIYENGKGMLEHNVIFANAWAGVEIAVGGDPVLRRNHIHDGKQGGVIVHEHGKGTLEFNEIFANALTGVEVRRGGAPTGRRNIIRGNNYQAIRIHTEGGGIFEDNDLRDNKKGAWDIDTSSLPNVIRKNNRET